MSIEITPEVFTADYTGRPGHRTFFLQARAGAGTHSFEIEKQQIEVLAEKLKELLILIDRQDTIGSSLPGRDPALALDEPVEPEWRIGTIGLAYDEDADRVLVVLEPEEEEDEEAGDDDDDDGLRLSLRRDQVRTFALHAEAMLGEGRPICRLCGLPMDPEGHACPASNGHHR